MHDIVLLEEAPHTSQRQVIAGQRRPFISGDERTRAQLGRNVAAMLINRQAHQRLNPREIDLTFGYGIFIIERYGHKGAP